MTLRILALLLLHRRLRLLPSPRLAAIRRRLRRREARAGAAPHSKALSPLLAWKREGGREEGREGGKES